MGITFLKSTLANIQNKKGSARKPQDEKEGIKSFKENQKAQEADRNRNVRTIFVPLDILKRKIYSNGVLQRERKQ
ncbi:MAG: hypothetical protein BA867_06785 [Desulfobacterales bacterium S5133MH16]|nr:MAG: hypothetical protein BA867_06785 [Desulfobacterales bacterium S5133MH16]